MFFMLHHKKSNAIWSPYLKICLNSLSGYMTRIDKTIEIFNGPILFSYIPEK